MKISATMTSPTKGKKGAVKKRAADGIDTCLAILEKRHKMKEIVRGGKAEPVKDKWTNRDGTLKRSFKGTHKKGTLEGSYGSELKRSRILERGGTIYPKEFKFLRFKTFDGVWHFAKSVTLPARPTVEMAVKNSEKDRLKILHDAVVKGSWEEL